MLTRSTAVFAVKSVQKTAEFYRDVLGFTIKWLWENPPTFGSIVLGKAEVFLCEQPEVAQHTDGLLHYFDAEDVDALHERHRAAGADIVASLENKPWGMREYTVRDPNGYRIRFGGPATYERPKTATDSLPQHIRISVALPSWSDYKSLFESVDWHVDAPAMQKALQNTFCAVVAVDTRSGEVVGMTRTTSDGKYVMIWDVIVRPSHQGQKIGSALLEETLAELRRRNLPQGTFVGLFTGKPEFYEHCGFKRSTGMTLAL